MVAFSRPLNPSTSIINLVDSDSEDPTKIEAKIEVENVSVPDEDIPQLPARAELAPKQKTRQIRKKREKHTSDAGLKRGHSLAVMWQPHQGHGACRGRRDSPCIFGEWSMPAPAAPSGYCDLCDAAMLASLHEALPARLTHVLNNLNQAVLEKGFLYVQEALGSSAEADYRSRVVRARHRRDPARVRRGPRPRKEPSREPRDDDSRSCCGRDGQACVFGVELQPVTSTSSGRCELCDPDCMKLLFRQNPARLTGLLRVLPDTALTQALDFVEKTIDNAAANDFKRRVLRARRRRDPERPKRKARGAYKKSDRR